MFCPLGWDGLRFHCPARKRSETRLPELEGRLDWLILLERGRGAGALEAPPASWLAVEAKPRAEARTEAVSLGIEALIAIARFCDVERSFVVKEAR